MLQLRMGHVGMVGVGTCARTCLGGGLAGKGGRLRVYSSSIEYRLADGKLKPVGARHGPVTSRGRGQWREGGGEREEGERET